MPRKPAASVSAPSTRPVVLLYPRFQPDYPDPAALMGLPLAALAVARPLVAERFDVQVIDQNADDRPIDRLQRLARPWFVGISCLGGRQIGEGIGLAKIARRLWRGVPIVWGGWSPTLMTEYYEHPSAARWVDIIVRGHGEVPVLELARRLSEAAGDDWRACLPGIPGLTWRERDGRIRRNPDGPLRDLSEPSELPYHLIEDLDAYYTQHKVINYLSSYGCPHRCGFCGIPSYTRKFRALPNERVVDDLEGLRALGMRSVIFYDDNFFTSKQRVVELSRAMIDRQLGLEWHSNGRLDQLVTCTDEDLALFVRSGCQSINVGLETGDQSVSDLAHKDIEVQDCVTLADRFERAGLRLSLNVMIGLPGETPESLVRSLQFLLDLHPHHPSLDVSWYMFMPAPATPLWDQLLKEGNIRLPKTFEELAASQVIGLEHPWYYASPSRRFFQEWRSKHKAIVWYFHKAFITPYIARPAWWKPGYHLHRWCRWRWERRFFRLRLDWRACFIAFTLKTHARWLWRRAARWRPIHVLRRALSGPRARRRSPGVPIPGINVPRAHPSA